MVNIGSAISSVAKVAKASKFSVPGFLLNVGLPLLSGYGLGYLHGKVVGAGFGYSIKAYNYLDLQIQKMRHLELGDGLTAGYYSERAATERQSVINAVQDSPYTNRRFLGREAKMCSYL